MSALENTLGPIAAAMNAQEDGFALMGYPLRSALSPANKAETVRILTQKVEEASDGRLTLCEPKDRLFYGYIQGVSVSLVLCKSGTPNPVASKQDVIKGWYLMSGGLLPATFDRMPDEATPYIIQMNGR